MNVPDFDMADTLAEIDDNLTREALGNRLIGALLDCAKDDRIPFVEALLDGLRAGMPIPLHGTIMDEARFWAASAARAERKAYCLAAFEALDEKDKAAFLAHARKDTK